MSKVNKLIQDLCPDGVKYLTLDELCDIKVGGDTPANYQKGQNAPSDQFPYPIYSNGTETYGYSDSWRIDKQAVTISSIGNVGLVAFREAFFTPIIRLKVLIPRDTSKLDTKYLYFIMSVQSIAGTNSTLSSINANDVKRLKIPLPPIEIQKEIVRILDKFVQTEENLSQELKIRAKQFEYYRNKLLTFGQDVEWKTLDQACEYVDYRGKTPKKVTSGIFLVTAKNIRKGYIDYRSSQEYISSDDYELVMRRGLPKLGDVLITTEAPCGYVAQVDREDIALAQRVIKYRSKNTSLNNSFLKHYLLSADFQKKLDKAATGSTVKGIKGSRLHKLTVPIPSIDEQNKIISLLDKFDVLVNDINEGIPAEINARQQQFEYYRKKLLTFQELPA